MLPFWSSEVSNERVSKETSEHKIVDSLSTGSSMTTFPSSSDHNVIDPSIETCTPVSASPVVASTTWHSTSRLIGLGPPLAAAANELTHNMRADRIETNFMRQKSMLGQIPMLTLGYERIKAFWSVPWRCEIARQIFEDSQGLLCTLPWLRKFYLAAGRLVSIPSNAVERWRSIIGGLQCFLREQQSLFWLFLSTLQFAQDAPMLVWNEPGLFPNRCMHFFRPTENCVIKQSWNLRVEPRWMKCYSFMKLPKSDSGLITKELFYALTQIAIG